jgi:hypothetical protein
MACRVVFGQIGACTADDNKSERSVERHQGLAVHRQMRRWAVGQLPRRQVRHRAEEVAGWVFSPDE